MSKVAIKGNASGTGTFTLEAPNSNTDRTLVLPDEAGTVLTSASTINGLGSLTVADTFRLTTNTNVTSEIVITSNLERADSTRGGVLGSGMSQSSGVFSFPTTGVYLILAYFDVFGGSSDSRSVDGFIRVSTDGGSNFTDVARPKTFIHFTQSDNTHTTFSGSYIMDVQNTSTDKVNFKVSSVNYSGLVLKGDTSNNTTHFTFVRLGDT